MLEVVEVDEEVVVAEEVDVEVDVVGDAVVDEAVVDELDERESVR